MEDYFDRLRQQGYTEKMLKLDKLMHEYARKKTTVRIVDHDDVEYVGAVSSYIKPDDEEDGFSTVCIDTTDKGGWCLGVNEIKSIELE